MIAVEIQRFVPPQSSAILTVQCRLDENTYDKGITVSDAEMARLNIKLPDFHGEWNYTIEPRKPDD